jgi:hypothetical protein
VLASWSAARYLQIFCPNFGTFLASEPQEFGRSVVGLMFFVEKE